MNRREFSLLATSAGLGLSLAPTAHAQGAPVEGTHYVKLSQPVPVTPTGKVEVVEFFWYGCPHCFALEPTLEQWVKSLPADVNFRRVPASFTPMYEFHQKLFYSLETLGLLGTLHRKVFNYIHLDRKPLAKEADVLTFATAQGVDGAKIVETMKSFSVQTKARQAKQLSEGYRIDGVPALGVQGKFYTSVAMAGGPERAFAVTDYLIDNIRKTPH